MTLTWIAWRGQVGHMLQYSQKLSKACTLGNASLVGPCECWMQVLLLCVVFVRGLVSSADFDYSHLNPAYLIGAAGERAAACCGSECEWTK